MSEVAISAEATPSLETHEAMVVGAGPAGLAAGAALQKRGFETLIIESSVSVGARWRSRYDELHLNSWRVMSNLQGYHMSRNDGRYPSRDDFVAYLERYASHHRLDVRPSTTVLRVDRAGDIWQLQTSTGPFFARYVVIATGWDAVPGGASSVDRFALVRSMRVVSHGLLFASARMPEGPCSRACQLSKISLYESTRLPHPVNNQRRDRSAAARPARVRKWRHRG